MHIRTRALSSLALLAAACSGEVAFETSNQGGAKTAASTLAGPIFATNPSTGLAFAVESHADGQAANLAILDVLVGRLADVYDRDPATGARTLRMRQLLIGEDIDSDGVDFELAQRLSTGEHELTVLHAFGTTAFDAAFTRLEAGLQPLALKSLDPMELPPFTRAPRNSALAIRCGDLLDQASVADDNVRVFAGDPPVVPFAARVLPDPSHGDLVGGVFHSTRVLVDFAVSPAEALASGLPVNPLGLPPAQTVARAGAGLRVPTLVNPAAQQFDVLKNLGGAGVSFTGNGPNDPASPTLDVVRAFRPGGPTAFTGDPNNGFASDSIRPQVLVHLACNLTSVQPTAVSGEYRATVRFTDPSCESRVRVGASIETATHLAEVVQTGATGARLVLVAGNPATFGPGPGVLTETWVPWLNLPAVCAVRFDPPPLIEPNAGVSPLAVAAVSFSEPIDPSSVRPFDTLTITLPGASSPLASYVVGHVEPSLDLTEFRFVPEVPLAHAFGQAERYLVDVGAVTDLAGNLLLDPHPQTDFTLAPAEPTVDSGGFALRFASVDESGDGKPELRGQFLFDLANQRILARPVARFSASADTSAPVVGAMTPLNVPFQTPLSQYGCRMVHVWRYHDLGFNLLDESTHNLDVESLSWSPFGGAPIADQYTHFQMSLAHAKYLPDEEVTSSLLPRWPASGAVKAFDSNLVDPSNDPPTVVHPANRGYSVDPSDVFQAPVTGIPLTHWPMNRGIPTSQFTYWTWRDSGKISVGAPNGAGADTRRLHQVTKSGMSGFYPVNRVPTIGLPLLTEFRTYPDAAANGLNGFRVAIAINSSAKPYFRAYSAGGVTLGGQTLLVDPDNAPVATGGIAPGTGQPTAPLDNAFYYGQADFVVRVSRLHTAWFDTGGTASFAPPVVDAGMLGLPAGTQVLVAFRGAISIGPGGTTAWADARNLDAYGDSYTAAQLAALGQPASNAFDVAFFNTPPNPIDKTWKANLTALNGARYVQARISFVANAASGLAPSLDSLGIAFQR